MTQPQNEPPSQVDVFIETARKLLIPLGATAGFVGALGLFYSDVEQALIKAVTSASIGFALSLGSYLLGPLASSTKRRAKYAGAKIDQVTDQVIVAATGFEEKYLRCQASDCESVRAEGMKHRDGIFEPLLKDVFVELQVDPSALSPGFNRLSESNSEELKWTEPESLPHQTIWDFLAESKEKRAYRQLVILAWGGYGKTTLLKHVAYRYGVSDALKGAPKLVPVLIVLRKHKEVWTTDLLPDLSEFIVQHHIPELPESHQLQPVPPNWAKNLLQKGHALVMFDGFDEVPREERPVVAKWINEQMRAYKQSVFVVTSRPKAYKEQDFTDQLVLSTPVWVQPLDDAQRKKFVESWYLAQENLKARRHTPEVRKAAAKSAHNLLQQIEAGNELKDLAKNPLLLNMIATFHQSHPGGALPKRRVDLYSDICDLQLNDRPRNRQLNTVLLEFKAQPVLEEIAFGMMQQVRKRIDGSLMGQEIAKVLSVQEEDVDATQLLQDVVRISELIVQQEDEYEFAHLSFQEYLTAAYIAGSADREVLLYEHLKEDWWKPTILLYAGLVNPTRLIQEAMMQGEDDLANDCLKETRKRIDHELQALLQAKRTQVVADEVAELNIVAKLVQEARYAGLERYLKNKQWRRADEETYRLMITEVGKDEGQWFVSEELKTFPCESLKVIDGLWVRHSNGRFGFSVQKEMYLECDGVPDGRYHREAFNKLREANGWTVRGEQISIGFDTFSPRGHLPFCRFGGGEMVSSLAFRLTNCNL